MTPTSPERDSNTAPAIYAEPQIEPLIGSQREAGEAPEQGLLASIVTATSGTARRDAAAALNRLDEFLAAQLPGDAIVLWLGTTALDELAADREALTRRLNRDVAYLDALLTDQVNAILHQPAFQQLEASWRGLRYLTEQLEEAENVKIRMLNVSWKELARDLERAIEFDQSQLFRKIYGDEFDTPGGEPFSVLIGDYVIHPRPSREHPIDDISVLRGISQVAAAAFAPFVAAVHPSMFGLGEFAELERPLNLSKTFDSVEYLSWKSFRETEDSRFVGLTMPRVLFRRPYEDDTARIDGFRYYEDVSGPGRDKYLWGNASFAFAAVMMRAFIDSGWLAKIHGVRRGESGGGLLTNLPTHSFSTDKRGLVPKGSTDVVITDAQEQELADLGFIPLCRCKDTAFSAFYTNQSAQKPKKYDTLAATMNAKISAMLQYMLCVSRFAHYLKVSARDKIGTFAEADELQNYLHRWIQHYVTGDSEATPEIKAEYPLREARIEVEPNRAKPGSFLCTAHLWPHFELDELVTSIRVRTELSPGQPV